MRFKRPEGVLARWLQELSNYDFDIVHQSGKKHSNADGLSRIVIDGECDCYIAGKDVTTLLCGGCEVCTRMQAQWRRFEEGVDDVVPLAYGMIVPGQGTTTASVGVQVPGDETWGDGRRLLEPRPIEEQGDSSPVTQMECGGEHDDDLLVRQIGMNGDPQPDQENEASPMGVESNFMSRYSLEDLKELQRQDVDLEPVIRWLAADVTPTEADLMLHSSSTKHMWLYREQLKLQQGVLFYEWDHGSGRICCWRYQAHSKVR